MISNKEIVTSFENRKELIELLKVNPGMVVVKFGASWCRPCKVIQPIVEKFFATAPENVICCDIDIDESFDLYSCLKFNKLTSGIPTILAYRRGNVTFIPDLQVTGTDPIQLDHFFTNCGDLYSQIS